MRSNRRYYKSKDILELKDATYLTNQYALGKSLTEIAFKLGVSIPTVCYWFDKHGIPKRANHEAKSLIRLRNPKYRKLQDHAWLETQYTSGKSISRIAKDIGVGPMTIHRWLRRYKIETRKIPSRRDNPFLLKADYLRREYEGGKSLQEIANTIGENVKTLEYWFNKHNIERRNSEQAQLKGRKKPDNHTLRMLYEKHELGAPEIARQYHVGKSAVYSWLESYNIPRRDRSWRVRKRGPEHPAFGQSPSPFVGFGKGGYRNDLGFYCRSSWEANFARLLTYLGIEYQYEPIRFCLGHITYTPDFYLPKFDLYIEITGFRRTEKEEKLEGMSLVYPEVKILEIEKNDYKQLVSCFLGRVNFEADGIITTNANVVVCA